MTTIQIEKLLKKARKVDFAAIKRYAVARHEDTVVKLIAIANKIEQTTSLWFPDGFPWKPHSDLFTANVATGVRSKVVGRDKTKCWAWLPGGIQFLYDIAADRCCYVSHRTYPPDDDRFKDSYAFSNFKLIPVLNEYDGEHAMTAYLKTPDFDTYFGGLKLNYLSDYTKFVEKVDEDYEYAEKCEKALEQAFETISENVEAYIAEAERLQSKARDVEKGGK